MVNAGLLNWNFGDGIVVNSTTMLNTAHVYTQPAEYVVTLSSNNGVCETVDSINIQVISPSGFYNRKVKSVDIILNKTEITFNFINVTEPKGDINFYDFTGRIAKRYNNVNFNGTQSFDITDLNMGNYIVTIGNHITKMICTIN